MINSATSWEVPMRIFWTNSSTSFRSSADHPGLRFYRFASNQPSWIGRVAVMAFAVVVGLPILLLIALALLVGLTLFGALALFNSALNRVTGVFRRPNDLEGRENVTVIRHHS